MIRQKTGSVLCISCGNLVGVNDERCLNCGRWRPGLWGFGATIRGLGRDFGFVKLVLTGSIALFIATLLIDPSQIRMGGGLSFLSPSTFSLFLFGASGAIPVFQFGRWWTVLSAGWLHGGVLHILFNMMWVRNLAPVTAEIYGPGRMVIIYTAGSVAGFALSSLAGWYFSFLPWPLSGARFTVGASAPLFGLLGALVYSGRRGVAGAVARQAWSYAVILFFFGLIYPGIDNYAHAGGFVGGYVAANVLNPLLPERGDHLLVALACLVATALSVVASFVLGLPGVVGG